MEQKILILGISSFAGASFANYILNKKKNVKFLEHSIVRKVFQSDLY